MKTTVNISDSLFEEATSMAAETGTTFRDLVEQGLRRVLDERDVAEDFELKDCRVDGEGLSARYRTASWSKIRDTAYGEEAVAPEGESRRPDGP